MSEPKQRFKVQIINNPDNSQTHNYFDLEGNLIKSHTEQKPIHNQQNPIKLPEVLVTAEKTNTGLLSPDTYLGNLSKAYETLYNNYTDKGLELPQEYTSFREVNDQIAKSIGDIALTYVGGRALKPLYSISKSAFPLLSKTVNLKSAKVVPKRFREGIKKFNINSALNNLVFNKLLSNPVSKAQLAGDIAAGTIMNHYINKPINNDKSVANMLSDASHFNSDVVSGILDLAAGAAWEKTVSNEFRNIMKRGTETVMRSSGIPNPLNIDTSKSDVNNVDLLKYILLGKGNKPLGGLLSKDKILYTGFHSHSTPELLKLKNGEYYPDFYVHHDISDYNYLPFNTKYDDNYGDVIDAVLYDKEIDPKFLKLISNGDVGSFEKYVNNHYPHKKQNIRVYSPDENPLNLNEFNVDKNAKKTYGISSSMNTLHPEMYINTAGHIITSYPLKDIDPGAYSVLGPKVNGVRYKQLDKPYSPKVIVEEDIYKFEPGSYSNKWHVNDIMAKIGLNVIDDISTPIIIKSTKKHIPKNDKVWDLNRFENHYLRYDNITYDDLNNEFVEGSFNQNFELDRIIEETKRPKMYFSDPIESNLGDYPEVRRAGRQKRRIK